MEVIELMKRAVEITEESPLSDFPEYSSKLKKFKTDLIQIKEKLNKKLKVVVMGEVKAGKSTLINSIVGREVSLTDVLEATSVILEISYSENERSSIYRGDLIEDTGDVAGTNTILSEHRGDVDFFRDIFVSMGLPINSLKEFHLVDTPGLSTITQENENKTINYIQESDVVLWVFNASHLGQSDVKEKMSQVARTGKPIIGIINRIDEVDSEPDVLVSYVEQNLGLYLSEIFAVSARQAFLGITEEKPELYQESGLNELLKYLKTEIEVKSDDVHEESIISSSEAIINSNIYIHQNMLDKIQFIDEKVNKFADKLSVQERYILEDIKLYIENEIETDLLEREKKEISKKIDELNLFSDKTAVKEIENFIISQLNEQKIDQWWNKMKKGLARKLEQSWRFSTEIIGEDILVDLNKFNSKQQLILQEKSNDNYDIAEITKFSKSQGFLYGGGAAAALTAAIGAIAWPAALAGVLVGGAVSNNQLKQERHKLKGSLIKEIDEFKRKVRSRINNTLIPEIMNENQRIKEFLMKGFARSLLPGIKDRDVDQLKLDIREYLDRCNKLVKDLEN